MLEPCNNPNSSTGMQFDEEAKSYRRRHPYYKQHDVPPSPCAACRVVESGNRRIYSAIDLSGPGGELSVVVRGEFAHEERELLGRIHSHKRLLGNIRLAIRERENHVQNATGAIER